SEGQTLHALRPSRLCAQARSEFLDFEDSCSGLCPSIVGCNTPKLGRSEISGPGRVTS
nr:hypothetical protein [Tanacetum cinerariifolium]